LEYKSTQSDWFRAGGGSIMWDVNSTETLSVTGRHLRLRPSLPSARLLTDAGHHRDERHATWLELFFDLVFVAAITQLSVALAHHATAAGFARFAGLFVVVWWVWVMFGTYADRFGTCDPFNRAAFLLAMLFTVALAASVPAAFAGHTAPFAIAYVLLKSEQLVIFERARRQVPAARRLYTRHGLAGVSSVAAWLASIAVVGPPRYALWGLAILAEMLVPWLSIGAARSAPLNVSHLPERFGIFLLIALGESVRGLVAAASHRPWTIPLAVVLAAAFTTIAAMWWISFNAIDHRAPSRGRLHALLYIYMQLPMVAGIAAASAGLHQAILAAAGGGPIPIGPRVALYGGTALYLLATAALPASTSHPHARRIRLVAALAAFTLVFMGAIVAPAYLVPALAAVLAIATALEVAPSFAHAGARQQPTPNAKTASRERGSPHQAAPEVSRDHGLRRQALGRRYQPLAHDPRGARPLLDSRGDAPDRAGAHVTGGEDARNARLERCPRTTPRLPLGRRQPRAGSASPVSANPC
jgi:low temperature requirement protein LtrA